MARSKSKPADQATTKRARSMASVDSRPPLVWLKASYRFHSFAYRDPRSAFSSAMGVPVVSPTTVLLGIASTLFSLGRAAEAKAFIGEIHRCKVAVDSPDCMIFFRAFHQVRRYETDKYSKTKGPNPRMGLSNINQGTREYGLVGGEMTVYIGVPSDLSECTAIALRNRDHLGTHDSLCSLVEDVKPCEPPTDVVYHPLDGKDIDLGSGSPVTVVTLSRFEKPLSPAAGTVGGHWWMAGGDDTDLVPYLIRGRFYGTSRGKIYLKH